ncbi:hypothetical protein AB0L67_40675 [Streptomyces flaveolus]|uniref:hypothetical protein n=1 Tax=Streptomyces flaveolus TaxID=67297 RepID=UPI0034220AA1
MSAPDHARKRLVTSGNTEVVEQAAQQIWEPVVQEIVQELPTGLSSLLRGQFR